MNKHELIREISKLDDNADIEFINDKWVLWSLHGLEHSTRLFIFENDTREVEDDRTV